MAFSRAHIGPRVVAPNLIFSRSAVIELDCDRIRDALSAFGATPDPARVVRDGNVITGGGVTAGIDFALTVLAEIAGDDYAQSVQLSIEYAPAPPFNSGRPELAPAHVLAATQPRYERVRPARDAAVERAAARLA